MTGSQASSDSEDGGTAALMPSFETGDKLILASVVKECQKRGYEGTEGDWKAFVGTHKGKLGDSSYDPKRQSFEMLAGFVASLSGNGKRVKMVKRHQRHAAQLAAEAAALAAAAPPTEEGELDGSGAVGQPMSEGWAGLVPLLERCRRHPRYPTNYALPSSERGWKRIQRQPSDYSQPPRLIAIDCEMCATDKEDKALVKVTAVDSKGKMLLDQLVQPAGTVVDWKTDITGITADQLKAVSYTRKDAQRDLLQLLGSPASTIVVGHSLHNDLRALRLDWEPVLDTALLFGYRNLPRASIGLAQLVSVLLGEAIRADDSTHDSAEDAKATMAIVQHTLTATPSWVVDPPDIKVDKEEQSKLMMHEIPKEVDLDRLRQLFPEPLAAAASIKLEEEASSERRRRVYAVFPNPQQANEAYEALPGAQTTDSLGRFQKIVFLEDTKSPAADAKAGQKRKGRAGNHQARLSIKVRKMAGHNGRLYGNDVTGRREEQKLSQQRQAREAGRGQ
eukprot:jgi/Tetstr1/453837/TSEL_004000.t1